MNNMSEQLDRIEAMLIRTESANREIIENQELILAALPFLLEDCMPEHHTSEEAMDRDALQREIVNRQHNKRYWRFS